MRARWDRGLRVVPRCIGVMDDAYISAPSFELLDVWIELCRWQFAEGRNPGIAWQFMTRVSAPFMETRIHCRVGAISVGVSGRETSGGELEVPTRLWLSLLRVDSVPMTWMDRLDPIPVDHFEELIGILETLEFDGNRYGDFWERYRPNHPWYERSSA
jgi:hypothetical protein